MNLFNHIQTAITFICLTGAIANCRPSEDMVMEQPLNEQQAAQVTNIIYDNSDDAKFFVTENGK